MFAKCSHFAQKQARNKPETWSRLGDSNWRTYALRVR
jgi:hypothetical protein